MASEIGDDGVERHVLAMMKDILTRVARETATAPGTRRVLTNATVERIRECLSVISARELALSGGAGDEISPARPRYPGQASRQGKVTIDVESIRPRHDEPDSGQDS